VCCGRDETCSFEERVAFFAGDRASLAIVAALNLAADLRQEKRKEKRKAVWRSTEIKGHAPFDCAFLISIEGGAAKSDFPPPPPL